MATTFSNDPSDMPGLTFRNFSGEFEMPKQTERVALINCDYSTPCDLTSIKSFYAEKCTWSELHIPANVQFAQIEAWNGLERVTVEQGVVVLLNGTRLSAGVTLLDGAGNITKQS